MSTLVKQTKTTYIWLAWSIFLIIFSVIYEHFSFGVISLSMVLLGVVPLILGFGVNFVLRLYGFNDVNRLYTDGLMCITFGMLLQGIFEIYGTTSSFTKYFYIIGTIGMILGIAIYLKNMRNS